MWSDRPLIALLAAVSLFGANPTPPVSCPRDEHECRCVRMYQNILRDGKKVTHCYVVTHESEFIHWVMEELNDHKFITTGTILNNSCQPKCKTHQCRCDDGPVCVVPH